jgi:hypothetical protein
MFSATSFGMLAINSLHDPLCPLIMRPVIGVPFGIPAGHPLFASCRALRIAAIIPITRLRSSSTKESYYNSSFVRPLLCGKSGCSRNTVSTVSNVVRCSWHPRSVRAESDMPLKKSDPIPSIKAATVPDASTLNESDDFRVPWLRLADFLLSPTPTANDIAVIEALARKEQDAIKRRIRRTAEQVKRQSKSKQ